MKIGIINGMLHVEFALPAVSKTARFEAFFNVELPKEKGKIRRGFWLTDTSKEAVISEVENILWLASPEN